MDIMIHNLFYNKNNITNFYDSKQSQLVTVILFKDFFSLEWVI